MSQPKVGAFAVAAKIARERAGLSQRQAERAMGWAQSKVSRIEDATRAKLPKREDVEALDETYGTNGMLLRLAGYVPGQDERQVAEDAFRYHIDALVWDLVLISGFEGEREELTKAVMDGALQKLLEMLGMTTD